jgi:hypothetical protein
VEIKPIARLVPDRRERPDQHRQRRAARLGLRVEELLGRRRRQGAEERGDVLGGAGGHPRVGVTLEAGLDAVTLGHLGEVALPLVRLVAAQRGESRVRQLAVPRREAQAVPDPRPARGGRGHRRCPVAGEDAHRGVEIEEVVDQGKVARPAVLARDDDALAGDHRAGDLVEAAGRGAQLATRGAADGVGEGLPLVGRRVTQLVEEAPKPPAEAIAARQDELGGAARGGEAPVGAGQLGEDAAEPDRLLGERRQAGGQPAQIEGAGAARRDLGGDGGEVRRPGVAAGVEGAGHLLGRVRRGLVHARRPAGSRRELDEGGQQARPDLVEEAGGGGLGGAAAQGGEIERQEAALLAGDGERQRVGVAPEDAGEDLDGAGEPLDGEVARVRQRLADGGPRGGGGGGAHPRAELGDRGIEAGRDAQRAHGARRPAAGGGGAQTEADVLARVAREEDAVDERQRLVVAGAGQEVDELPAHQEVARRWIGGQLEQAGGEQRLGEARRERLDHGHRRPLHPGVLVAVVGGAHGRAQVGALERLGGAGDGDRVEEARQPVEGGVAHLPARPLLGARAQELVALAAGEELAHELDRLVALRQPVTEAGGAGAADEGDRDLERDQQAVSALQVALAQHVEVEKAIERALIGAAGERVGDGLDEVVEDQVAPLTITGAAEVAVAEGGEAAIDGAQLLLLAARHVLHAHRVEGELLRLAVAGSRRLELDEAAGQPVDDGTAEPAHERGHVLAHQLDDRLLARACLELSRHQGASSASGSQRRCSTSDSKLSSTGIMSRRPRPPVKS